MEIKEILEKISLPARSDKHGFKDTSKLDAIETLLAELKSPYHIIEKNEHAWIFGQNEPKLGVPAVLVSSHADIVSQITEPFSELNDQYFKGTYDNQGTNGACVYIMANEPMPENIYFAFTAEEESGKCTGAMASLTYLHSKTHCEPVCIALDVTDEGYDSDRLFTLEGLHAKSDIIRQKILSQILSCEGEAQSFEVVRLKHNDDVSMLPESYVAKGTTVFDESVFYAKRNCNSFSLCLPCDGFMHSNSGLYVKEPVMNGYIKSLASVLYALTKTYPERIKEIKAEKDELVTRAKEIEQKHPSYYNSYSYNSSYTFLNSGFDRLSYHNDYAYDDDDDWEYNLCNDTDVYENALSRYINECYEAADDYVPEEYDVFFQDMVHMYGLDPEDTYIQDTLLEIFAEVHCAEGNYDDYE